MKIHELKRVIQRINDLPTLPRIVFKITELVNNPRSSASDLSRIITEDQILTARLLRLVNSACYGFPRKISTVTDAVVLLGFDAIRNLLLTTSIFDLFSYKSKLTSFDCEQLWDHSLGCAVGAKAIGRHLKHEKIEELFVSGLLHDIGKIVEMHFLPEQFDKIISQADENNKVLFLAEQEILGYTHVDIGKLLSDRWNLPSIIAHVILHHHSPGEAKDYVKEVAIVHFADILCRALDIGSGGDNKIPMIDGTAWESINLRLSDIEPIMIEMEEEFFAIKFSIYD